MRYTHLVLRGNLYYFQCRVPGDIKHYFPGMQIKNRSKPIVVSLVLAQFIKVPPRYGMQEHQAG